MTNLVKTILALMAIPSFVATANAQQGAHPYSAAPAQPATEFLADEGYAMHDSMSTPSGHIISIWCHETRNSGIMVVFVPETDAALVYQSVPVCEPAGQPS